MVLNINFLNRTSVRVMHYARACIIVFIQLVQYIIYNNETYLFIFIGCWPWSIRGHTQMTSKSRQITSANLLIFFFSSPLKSFNKPIII